MDRARRRPGFLIVLAVLAGGLSTGDPPLRAVSWLPPGIDRARALTERPHECLKVPASAEEAYLVEVGRAAFRSPLVLGGQAARAGIDCETCHRNGRVNRDFDFPGVSGAPGTADVTSFVFSTHRGDHVDNPKPIPDLGGPKSALRISQAEGAPDLERFIHGLVAEEFDGAEPPPIVLRGLAAYVRALSPQACSSGGFEAVTADGDISDARRAVLASLSALARNDKATAVVMVGAARSALGVSAERFAPAGLADGVHALRLADLDLAAAISDIRRSDPAARVSLETWLARSVPLARTLRAEAPASYYNRKVLAAAIGEPASGHPVP